MLIATVIIAIGVFGYWYATSGGTPAPKSALQSSGVQTGGANSPLSVNDTAISDKFLTLLLNMKTIKLDQSIFSDVAFTSLRDFSTTIAPETNPGRANPFAPIGFDVAGTANIIVTTGQPSTITKNTATFVGSLPLGSIAAKQYFEYGNKNTTPLSNITAGVPSDPSTGTFIFNLVGLVPNTIYYYRAAAISNGATVYGQLVSFKTLAQ